MIFSTLSGWFSQIISGGTFEIILLILLIIVALIVFLVVLWLLWKLLILLGKGLLWLITWGSDRYGTWSQNKREARLSAPPLVSVGWGAAPGSGIRGALAQARGLVGQDAVTIVVIAGEGFSDLCRSLGLTPPGVGTLGITAGGNTILIDATQANSSILKRLARALPWRRPVDGLVSLVNPEGVPTESVVRTAIFARQTGMRIALHFVLPSTSKTVAWQIIDAQNRDGDTICSQLAADTMRGWLTGGSRDGMVQLAEAQSRELPSAIDRTILAAPSSVIDIASLCFGGAGLRAAVAQTVERTRPEAVLGYAVWAGFAAFTLGLVLTALVAYTGLSRAQDLQSVISGASREAAVPWVAEDINTIPSAAKIRRVAGLATRLSEYSSFSLLMPLATFVPNYSAPQNLAAAFLVGYVLRPLAEVLDHRTRELLTPTDDPIRWMENARKVDEWFAAWEGLSEDPREVNLRLLFVDAFGGTASAWAEGTDIALIDSGVTPPTPELGGLDIDALTNLARTNFIATMQNWADKVYTNGPVASSARKASDNSANWRNQHQALTDLRLALQDPAQQWLTATKDKPDHVFELRVLGRALGLSLFGQATALQAKAAVSSIRIDARDTVGYFILPGVGPILVRSGGGGSSSGPAVTLTREASAWLAFLDRVAAAGFTDLPTEVTELPVGLVTLDSVEVANARRKLRIFDQFASDLPAGLPPSVAQGLVREVTSELVVGITLSVEQALRYTSLEGLASEQAQRLARITPAMKDLTEIEAWLRTRQAENEAQRVLAVRSRAAEAVLIASADVLTEENPVGIYPDPAADGNALVRRYERGVERLERIFEQYARPFIEPASLGSGWAALEWRNMERDIDAYKRGDPDSVLSGLEGMVRAYAEDPGTACKAPRAPLSGRDDYLAKTMFRFRSELDFACLKNNLADARLAYQKLVDYFDRHVDWLWPYASDAGASEITPSTLTEFITQVLAAEDYLVELSEPFAKDLLNSAHFWGLDQDGAAVVKFRIDWRTRRAEETLAEHIVDIEVNGAQQDGDGNYTWRYGAPLTVRLKLAQNSPYRFVGANNSQGGLEKVINGKGNGSWLYIFKDLINGTVNFAAKVRFTSKRLAPSGADTMPTYPLRITARITHEDGRPMRLPKFSQHADYQLKLTANGG